ncbi:MAG: ATP-dependent exonuclease [Prevotellaceae bacterium]|jgi:exonuclease SbcC|nr:ATP-dependent exonuclease [Prevotellaceae bacterium]
MKILAIRGKNLASLEGEFVVDFDVEPLKSAGIFAITGPTGAGKSTILDAMCLALFDDAPRISKGERNVQISDVLDRSIGQMDSRVILRKGTGEGRAEVDFIALNGEKYRSTWSVRRTGNKPDGVLQNSDIRLYNLNANTEVQGTKTALLKTITLLTGLTFNQFIRAVLLAQGDFATFLKAKQSDKAELLEKLTGTDIYSKISTAIYYRTKEVTETLTLLQQRINDIKLLSDEEVVVLYQKKSQIDKDLEPVKNILSSIDKKLGWIKRFDELSKDVEEAKTKLNHVRHAIEEAKPRYAYIEFLDMSLEIRDVFIDMENKVEQLKKQQSNLSAQELLLKKYGEQIAVVDAELLSIKTAREQVGQEFLRLKPAIARCKELDIKIQSAKEKLVEAKNEQEQIDRQKTKSENKIRDINKDLDKTRKRSDIITEWFKEKQLFKDVVQQSDLIIATLNDILFIEKQIETASENLKTGNALMLSQTKMRERLEQESERLNSLLPTEILNLREKLEENKPCPVCGSIHHPFNTEINQTTKVNEKELENKKKETAKAIVEANKTAEATKETITQLGALVEGYKTQYENAIQKIETPLLAINNWKKFIGDGVLQKKISTFTALWKENEQELTKNQRETELFTVSLNTENALMLDISNESLRRATLYNDAASRFESLVNERSLLLDGKNAGEVESFYNKAIEQQSTKYENLKNEKTEIENRKSEITGSISTVRKNIETSSTQIVELKAAVDEWLRNNNRGITLDILKNLVTKSFAWIAAEKRELVDLKDKEIQLAATCYERTVRLDKHNESPHKPDTKESKESLEQYFDEVVNRENELKHQQTSIEVTLAKHGDNKKLVESLNVELKTNMEVCENWKRLNSLLGSADGHRFKNIIQSYTMDILLEYANKHLESLTKRYRLEKTKDPLALQVIDNDMFGEVRTIHSLSGGESFLISLSLALGLSALSSNRMQIESLFIDEGFGSLDADTLNMAIDALENLYTRGRKIGIISHVGEMRIPVQIKVIKSVNGKSEIKISTNN